MAILLVVRIYRGSRQSTRIESANVVDNWREYIASDLDETPHLFQNPYPVPTWTVRPSYLSGLALTLPASLPRTPSPSPEPPSGAPSHIQREDVKQEPSYSSCMSRVHCSIVQAT